MNADHAPRVLPFAPVVELLAQRNLDGELVVDFERGQRAVPWDAARVGFALGAETLEAARRRFHRAQHRGLSVWEADRLACALGWLPWTIWGPEWFAARGERERAAV